MAKRKANTQRANKPKRTKPSHPDTLDPKPSFRFLDLPTELRAHILSFAAQNGTALLKRSSRGHISTADPIALASKQLRFEYLDVLPSHAQTTLVHVRDFDFRHLVAYFNRLTKAEKAALPTTTTATKAAPKQHRTLRVLLELTANLNWWDCYLARWLKRRRAARKTGADAEVEYGVLLLEDADLWEVDRPFWPFWLRDRPEEAAQMVEVEKMKVAIDRWLRERGEGGEKGEVTVGARDEL